MDLNRNDSPNNNNNNNDGRKPGGNRPKGSIGTALLITLAIVLLVNWIYGSISKSQYTQTSFSDFLAAKDAGQLSEVEIQSDRIIYMTKEEAGKPAAMQKACYTGLPGGGDLIALSEELDAMGVKVDKKIVEDNSLIMMILSYALMIGGLFLVMNLLTKRMGGDGMMGGFGKSKAKVYMEKQTGVTFKDVAGQDEAKESLQEIIDFLHNPQKYTAIGAKLPKGALLVGSPGTGTTARLTSPSSPFPVRTLWRCSWAWAQAVSVTCSSRRRRSRPVSSSLTRSMPLAAPGTTATGTIPSRSRRSTSCSARSTASSRPRASCVWRRPTAPRFWTRHCSVPAGSTAGSSWTSPTFRDGWIH